MRRHRFVAVPEGEEMRFLDFHMPSVSMTFLAQKC